MRFGSQAWIWLNAAAVGLCLCTLTGLLLLIAVRGLGHFWPADLQLYAYLDDAGATRRVLGELIETETVSRRQHLESGVAHNLVPGDGPLRRLVIKTGNRRLDPPDFAHIFEHRIESVSAPPDAVVLERVEWGNAHGEVLAVNGAAHGNGDRLWQAFKQRMEAARRVRETIKTLAGTTLEAAEEERHRRLHRQLDANSFTLRLANGRLAEVPFGDVLRAWRPNRMNLAEKLGHYVETFWLFLSQPPREANAEGGVFPAILGTVTMVLLMSVLVTPLGVAAAIYLHEYARPGVFVRLIRIAVNNLAGVPSIIYGVFGLGFFVYLMGDAVDQTLFRDNLPAPTFGAPGLLWASLTLALLTLPVVVVSTEEGLSRIPKTLREGSLALGATQAETLFRLVLPAASPSVLTGLILAVARAAGEVAPLMLVGVVKLAPNLPVDGEFPYLHLERKFMHLGFHIFDLGFQSPNVAATRPLVYATALLLVAVIVTLNLTAILLRNRLAWKFRQLS